MPRLNSRHFTVTELGSGVYAAIHQAGGWAISNAGFVDLGDRTLVYDTFLNPRAARDLKEMAESLTGNPVKMVVNSHYHNDHTWGNMAFAPQAEILSSQETRELINTEGAKEVALYREISAARLESLQAQYEQETAPAVRQGLLEWITYFESLVETMPILEVCPANITFQEAMTVHSTDRTVELIAFAHSHTASDTVLYLPEDGVLFMSDLLFVDTHPYLGDGEVDQLLITLEALRGFGANHLVPGHGPAGSPRHIDRMVDYVHTCQKVAETFRTQGREPEEVSSLTIPEKFSGWDLPMFYQENIRALL